MKVAVLSLVRDRPEYTQHCFASLRWFAGCEFDHYVLDQGSDWPARTYLYDTQHAYRTLVLLHKNVGISRGMNQLLNLAADGDYDVIVKVDNDCELTHPNTLRDVAQLALEGGALLSPRILGLNNPPRATGTFEIDGEQILDIPQIGGIFLAAPASVFDSYRYPADGPAWGLDDADICRWYRAGGGRCGYVERLAANHYEGTSGQHARYPEYFARTLAEGKPSL